MIDATIQGVLQGADKFMVYTPFVKVTGMLSAAAVLSKLVYWFSPAKNGKVRAGVRKEGRTWTALSSTQVEQEMGLTRKEFRYALDKLVKMGLVVKRLWKYAGAPTLHLSLECNQLHSLLAPLGQSIGPVGPMLYKDSGLDSVSVPTASLVAKAVPAKAFEEGVTGGEGEEKAPGHWDDKEDHPTGGMKLDDVKAKLMGIAEAAKKPAKLDKVTKMNLALIWKKHVSANGVYTGDLTQTQTRALGHLIKVCGHDAGYVLDYALTHWSKFIQAVRINQGVDNLPANPSVLFLVKYVEEARAGWLQRLWDVKKPAPYHHPTPTPQASPGGSQQAPGPVPDEDKPATKEEVEAILAQFAKMQTD